MNKIGQMDTVMSWFVFASYVLILFFVGTTLCSCSFFECDKPKKSIETDFGMVADLRASEQLSGYLRTKLPNQVIRDLDKHFLDEHPEVYADSTYGEFISRMCVHEKDEGRADAFDAVTEALFEPQKTFEQQYYDFEVEVFCKDPPEDYDGPSLTTNDLVSLSLLHTNTGLKVLPKTGPDSGVITVMLKIDPIQEKAALSKI